MGKTLAASQLFIFLSGLLADFKFRSTDEDHLEKLDLEPNVGFTLTPKPFLVVIEPRRNNKKGRI